MIEQSNNLSYEMSDSAVLRLLGNFIRETRLMQNKTQEQLAATAGIKRMTLVRIEKEGGGTMATFIRVLRSLQQFHLLNQFLVPTQFSPLQLARLEQHRRQRARPNQRSRKADKKNDKKSDW